MTPVIRWRPPAVHEYDAARAVTLPAADVAAMLALLKLSRLAHDATSRDGARDLAGYAALMHEVAHHAPARDLPASGPLSASQADMAGGE